MERQAENGRRRGKLNGREDDRLTANGNGDG